LAPADRIDTIDTRTGVPQFAMNRPSGIYRRADTTSPLEAGLDNRVSVCGWICHSGNGILSDKIPTGGSLEGLRSSRRPPTERAAARAARINLSSDGDNHVAD